MDSREKVLMCFTYQLSPQCLGSIIDIFTIRRLDSLIRLVLIFRLASRAIYSGLDTAWLETYKKIFSKRGPCHVNTLTQSNYLCHLFLMMP